MGSVHYLEVPHTKFVILCLQQSKRSRSKNSHVVHPDPSPVGGDPVKVGGVIARGGGGDGARVEGDSVGTAPSFPSSSSSSSSSSRSSKKKKKKMQKVDAAALLGFTVNAAERPNMGGEIQSAKDAV